MTLVTLHRFVSELSGQDFFLYFFIVKLTDFGFHVSVLLAVGHLKVVAAVVEAVLDLPELGSVPPSQVVLHPSRNYCRRVRDQLRPQTNMTLLHHVAGHVDGLRHVVADHNYWDPSLANLAGR